MHNQLILAYVYDMVVARREGKRSNDPLQHISGASANADFCDYGNPTALRGNKEQFLPFEVAKAVKT